MIRRGMLCDVLLLLVALNGNEQEQPTPTWGSQRLKRRATSNGKPLPLQKKSTRRGLGEQRLPGIAAGDWPGAGMGLSPKGNR